MSTNSVPTDPLAALDALVATSAHQKARQAEFAEWVHCRQQDRALLREAFEAVRHYQCADGSEAFALGWAVAIHRAAEQVCACDLKRELDTHNPSEEAEALQAAKQVLRAALEGGIESATVAARKLASAPICEDIRFYFGVLGSNFVGLLERRDEREAWRLYRDRMPHPDQMPQLVPCSPPKREPVPEFALFLDGGVYQVRGFGQEGKFSKLEGFAVLGKLLAKPHTPVSMTELAGESGAVVQTSAQPQETVDAPAMKQYREVIKRLKEEVATAKNEVERADSQEKLDALLKHVNPTLNNRGKSRHLDNPTDKLRSRISANLKTVYDHFRSATPTLEALADHLRKSIGAEGDSFAYRPNDPAPTWFFGD